LSLVRKLIHLAMAVVPASYPLALGLAGVALLASLLVEAARCWWPALNRLLWRLLPTTFRTWEDRRVLGSTWFSLGMFAALLLFGRDAGGTAVLFLAWGDAIAGVSFGGLSPWAAGAGAVVAVLVERWSPPPDDNLWLPILSGLAIVAVEQWLGVA